MIAKKLVCSRCNVSPKPISVEGSQEWIKCPVCETAADGETAIKAARKYLSNIAVKDIQQVFRRSVRGSKNIKYKPERVSSITKPSFIYVDV